MLLVPNNDRNILQMIFKGTKKSVLRLVNHYYIDDNFKKTLSCNLLQSPLKFRL
jgi:hypothetical protein